ncbi:MAG: hypothetical protein IIV74_02725 [Alphaproteobacteria bacterium]|nr:hypothetical protein [Alphaproteobacteria bacterium]
MIDYDATLKKFFDEIIVYLQKRLDAAKDKVEQTRIAQAMIQVNKVAENPKKYADYNVRVKDEVEVDPAPFMPKSHDNSVFLIYRNVVWNMADLYSESDYRRQEAQKSLLNSLKQMKYKNASNKLKDLYFPFVSPEKYAVKTDKLR